LQPSLGPPDPAIAATDGSASLVAPAPTKPVTGSLQRALVAEAIGTFALVFAGAGAVMVDAKTHALGHVGVALTFGLVIMAMIYAVGHISGAHFNGAVTFAFALSRHFPWPRALGYWLAQFLGALTAPRSCAARSATSPTSARRCLPARRASPSSGSSC
jgi:Major intrinsic protein